MEYEVKAGKTLSDSTPLFSFRWLRSRNYPCRLQARYVLTVKRLGNTLLADSRALKRADFDVARPERVLWFETSHSKFNLKEISL
jgi:hypothetical protein